MREIDVVDRRYVGRRSCDRKKLAGEHGRDLGVGGEESDTGRSERERREVEAEEVKGGLGRFLERGIGESKDGG